MSTAKRKFHESSSSDARLKKLRLDLDELLSTAPTHRTTSLHEALNIIRRFTDPQSKKN